MARARARVTSVGVGSQVIRRVWQAPGGSRSPEREVSTTEGPEWSGRPLAMTMLSREIAGVSAQAHQAVVERVRDRAAHVDEWFADHLLSEP